MNLEKKVAYQQRYIKELEHQLEELRASKDAVENEFMSQQSVLEERGKNLDRQSQIVEDMKSEFKALIQELKDMKHNYEAAVQQATEMRTKYRDEVNEQLKRMRGE